MLYNVGIFMNLLIVVTSFQSIKNLISLINNFESHVKKTLQAKMQKAMRESWRAKISLWLSSRDFKDFENLVIASIVRELLQLIRNNKIVLCIRVFAYTVALFLFRESLIHVIKYMATFV